jgi:hypothetical protein
MKNKETKLINYTITFNRNNGSWNYQNILAKNEKQARDVFNIGLKEGINKAFYVSMSKKEREDEFNKYKIITVTKII